MAGSVATFDFLGSPTEVGDLGSLAHYRVIDELGKGGMGYVFRAIDSKLQRTVALKVMNKKIAATANSRSRFMHEARAMAAVRHDNVATIFEVGESDGIPFMAMEMLKGETLETFNKDEHRLGYEKIIQYARQITRGLAAAHSNGIVHRDIKPANIWIEEGIDRIKILDFGLALASTPVDHLAGRGAVIGTPGYLSPEQARSEPLDDRSDLYSLGVVLYELCTGKLPLRSGSVSGQLIAILAQRPTPINELNPDIPEPLCGLVHRLLRKEPRSRPQSAVALEAELEQVRKKCDATCKVAQAINKLQVGLTEVVSKSEAESVLDTIDDLSEVIPDPLAGIPTALTSPVGKANSGRLAVPTASAQQKAGPVGPNWQVHAPLLVMAAIIVSVLPLTAFFFSQTGRSTEAIITKIPGEQATPSPLEAIAERARADEEQRRADVAKEAKLQEEQRQADATKTDTKSVSVAGPSNQDVESVADKIIEQPTDSSPEETAVTPPKVETNQEKDPSLQPKKVTPAEPPAPQFEWKEITTGNGQGADVTVRKGIINNLDDLQTISIRKRGNIETEHTYLRFDLAAIQSVKKNAEAVELVLVVAGDWPLGSVIRIHGAPKLGIWPEQKLTWTKSYSLNNLATEPLLATYVVRAKGNGPKLRADKIRISSDELTKFIAQSPGNTVTLILAGSGPGKEKAEFCSREKAPQAAPKLRIKVPKVVAPPADPIVNGVEEIRKTLSQLKGLAAGRTDRIVGLLENGNFDQALNSVNELIGEVRAANQPRSLKQRLDKKINQIAVAIRSAAEQQKESEKASE